MAFFQAKTGWKRSKMRENKICHSVPFRTYPMGNRKFQKKAKKLKKLKYTIMVSFQDKIGWKMPRNRKNKNYRSVPFPHEA